MPNILILGATGYIGKTLALSLLRSGSHTVYGVARSPASAKALQALEITPVLGSITDSTTYLSLIRALPIDIVVDCAGAGPESRIVLADLMAAGKERLQRAAENVVRLPKLGFVYVSGTWVHGSSSIPVNDLTPVGCALAPTPPARLVAWRTVMEQEVLSASETLDVVVIRPALVFGRENSIWSSLFAPLASAANSGQDCVSLNVNEDSRPALCHVDDVASGLHCAIDKLPLLSGTGVYPVFDLITSQESMRDILAAAGRALGYEGEIKMVGAGEDEFMQAMCVSTNGSSGRAKEILGWVPRRFGYSQNMGVVAMAWRASQ